MMRYGFDFRVSSASVNALDMPQRMAHTFGWDTRWAISSVVISVARFFDTDFFFGMVTL